MRDYQTIAKIIFLKAEKTKASFLNLFFLRFSVVIFAQSYWMDIGCRQIDYHIIT